MLFKVGWATCTSWFENVKHPKTIWAWDNMARFWMIVHLPLTAYDPFWSK